MSCTFLLLMPSRGTSSEFGKEVCRWARTEFTKDRRVSVFCGLGRKLCHGVDNVAFSRDYSTCGSHLELARARCSNAEMTTWWYFVSTASTCPRVCPWYQDARFSSRDAFRFRVVFVGCTVFGRVELSCRQLFGLVSLCLLNWGGSRCASELATWARVSKVKPWQ